MTIAVALRTFKGKWTPYGWYGLAIVAGMLYKRLVKDWLPYLSEKTIKSLLDNKPTIWSLIFCQQRVKRRLEQWDAINRNDLKLLTEDICEQVSVYPESDWETSPLKVVVDSLSARQKWIFLAFLLVNPNKQKLALVLKNIEITPLVGDEIVESVVKKLPLEEHHYVTKVGRPELVNEDFLSTLPKDLIHYIAKMLSVDDRRQLLFANRKMFHFLGGSDSAPLWMEYGSICAIRNMYIAARWVERAAAGEKQPVRQDSPMGEKFYKNVKHLQQGLFHGCPKNYLFIFGEFEIEEKASNLY
jgi:hypothetical protein